MPSRRLFLALTGGAFASLGLSWGAVDVPTVLDHILLGSSDLDGGITFVKENTGVTPVWGGVHPGRGTRNALLSLGERHYLEIIAPDPAQPGSPDAYGLKKLSAPRLVGWAAHPGDLDGLATRLRNAGLAFEGPTPGERKRPDGRLLRWKTLNLHDNEAGLLPFFIEWTAGTVHPSADAPSGCRILRFELSAPNEAELQRLCTLLGLDVPITHGERPRLLVRIAGPGGRLMALAS
jgi:Glyoxalase-like domain